MEQSIIIAGLIAVAVLLVAFGIWVRLFTSAREERLHHFIGQYREGGTMTEEQGLPANWRDRLTQRLNRYISNRDFVQSTRRDLLRAGLQIKPTQFFLFRLMLALGGGALTGVLLLSQGTVWQLAGTVGGLIIGYLLVRPFLGYKQRKRLDAFEKQFADGLDIMVGGLESGSSLTAAVQLVGREMPAPLSTEFSRVVRDASLGMSYEDAFKAMHERLPSDDLGMLVSAISVQFRVGGNLATVLRTLSETVRERLRIRGEIKTLTAQQRMTARLVTAVPFIMIAFLLALNRAYMTQIFEPGPQRIFALIGVAGIVLGNLAIRRTLRIEV